MSKLERKLRKPVISSNTGTLWACLRAAEIKDAIKGFDQLLSENKSYNI